MRFTNEFKTDGKFELLQTAILEREFLKKINSKICKIMILNVSMTIRFI